jgi:hypothetical protein
MHHSGCITGRNTRLLRQPLVTVHPALLLLLLLPLLLLPPVLQVLLLQRLWRLQLHRQGCNITPEVGAGTCLRLLPQPMCSWCLQQIWRTWHGQGTPAAAATAD